MRTVLVLLGFVSAGSPLRLSIQALSPKRCLEPCSEVCVGNVDNASSVAISLQQAAALNYAEWEKTSFNALVLLIVAMHNIKSGTTQSWQGLFKW